MSRPQPVVLPSSRYRRTWLYGAVRTALIGYGIAAFMLFSRTHVSETGAGEWSAIRQMLLWGVGLQLVLLAVRTSRAATSAPMGCRVSSRPS